MSFTLTKFLPLTKIIEHPDGRHEVFGLATAEEPDKENEISIYSDTKTEYQRWSQSMLKATTGSGQEVSLGNVRLNHDPKEIAGKVTRIDFEDARKQIFLCTEPLNDRIWDMIKRGFITGFSQGGDYAYRKCNDCGTDVDRKTEANRCSNCKKDVLIKYAPAMAEVSYVDAPCLPSARFTYIKSDGSTELVKFHKPSVKPSGTDVIRLEKDESTHELIGVLEGIRNQIKDLDLSKFDPSQPRASDGKWTNSGAGARPSRSKAKPEASPTKKPKTTATPVVSSSSSASSSSTLSSSSSSVKPPEPPKANPTVEANPTAEAKWSKIRPKEYLVSRMYVTPDRYRPIDVHATMTSLAQQQHQIADKYESTGHKLLARFFRSKAAALDNAIPAFALSARADELADKADKSKSEKVRGLALAVRAKAAAAHKTAGNMRWATAEMARYKEEADREFARSIPPPPEKPRWKKNLALAGSVALFGPLAYMEAKTWSRKSPVGRVVNRAIIDKYKKWKASGGKTFADDLRARRARGGSGWRNPTVTAERGGPRPVTPNTEMFGDSVSNKLKNKNRAST